MKHRINYYGTDPNNILVERLDSLTKDYKQVNGVNTIVDIRSHGSEVFIPEWDNTIGVAFSSPPYFNLEDYKIGNQSYKEGISYEDWLSGYLKETIKNIYKYLIPSGNFLINVKDFSTFKLCSDIKSISISCGFTYVEDLTLKNIARTSAKKI